MEWLLLVAMLNGEPQKVPLKFYYTDVKTCEMAEKKITQNKGKATCIPQGKTKKDPFDKMLDLVDKLQEQEKNPKLQ